MLLPSRSLECLEYSLQPQTSMVITFPWHPLNEHQVAQTSYTVCSKLLSILVCYYLWLHVPPYKLVSHRPSNSAAILKWILPTVDTQPPLTSLPLCTMVHLDLGWVSHAPKVVSCLFSSYSPVMLWEKHQNFCHSLVCNSNFSSKVRAADLVGMVPANIVHPWAYAIGPMVPYILLLLFYYTTKMFFFFLNPSCLNHHVGPDWTQTGKKYNKISWSRILSKFC